MSCVECNYSLFTVVVVLTKCKGPPNQCLGCLTIIFSFEALHQSSSCQFYSSYFSQLLPFAQSQDDQAHDGAPNTIVARK